MGLLIYLRAAAALSSIALVTYSSAQQRLPARHSSVRPPAVAVKGAINIGMNLQLAGNSYYGSQYPFIDRFKTVGDWAVQGGQAGIVGSDAIKFDADGNPLGVPAGVDRIYAMVGLDPSGLPTGDRYVLTYEGTASINPGFGRIVSSEPGKIVFDFSSPDLTAIPLVITSIDAKDPIHDIHIVREDQLALFQAGEIFNPAFLEKASQWGVLRFMDWGSTNNNPIADWADRPTLAQGWGQDVPLEVMVRLANETKTDMWYNMPAHANDEFVRNTLTYIKDHLDPSLKLQLEYSNEVWNWQFEQARYAAAMGQKTFGFSGNGDWVTYYGYRSAQIAHITDEVFGAQSDQRVSNVIATQTGWIGLENYIFDGIARANVGTVGNLFEDYAITTYFGGTLMSDKDADRATVLGWAREGQAGVDKAIREMATGGILSSNDSLARLIADIYPKQAEIAAKHGLDLVAYEGGFHINAINYPADAQDEIVAFFKRVVNDPAAGDLYAKMANAFADAGGTQLVAFNDVGPTTKWGAWGIIDDIFQISSPRYDALKSIQQKYDADHVRR